MDHKVTTCFLLTNVFFWSGCTFEKDVKVLFCLSQTFLLWMTQNDLPWHMKIILCHLKTSVPEFMINVALSTFLLVLYRYVFLKDISFKKYKIFSLKFRLSVRLSTCSWFRVCEMRANYVIQHNELVQKVSCRRPEPTISLEKTYWLIL